MHRNFKMVSRIVFGAGCFSQLDTVLADMRTGDRPFMVFLVDDVFSGKPLQKAVPVREGDFLQMVSTENEPKTKTVDILTDSVRAHAAQTGGAPAGVVGIGGGSVMDIAKAVSLMLTNPGSAADYQGWDLIKNPAVYHVAVPTLSGTGAEVSRTTVLTGPEKKLGINSDYTVFDQVVLDPELTRNVPEENKAQWFYTGMDCYIHCIESLSGHFMNAFSRAYGEKALSLCREVYLSTPEPDKLMMASVFGGMSIAYSQVGAAHALSYGLGFMLGIRHGVGNCIAFNALTDLYPEGVAEFRKMADRHDVSIPQNVVSGEDPEIIDRMIDVSLVMEPLWHHALGPDWKTVVTRDKLREYYLRM